MDALVAPNDLIGIIQKEFCRPPVAANWAIRPFFLGFRRFIRVRLVHKFPVYEVWHGLYLSGEMDVATRQCIFNILS